MVILVGMDVEKTGVTGERTGELRNRPGVTTLGDVGDGFERQHNRTLGAVKVYYDRRAPEYDDWYLGVGRWAGIDRPEWDDELAALVELLRGFPPERTLDVACGTGFLTQHLPGPVTCLDQSARMLAIASRRVPNATIVHGDGVGLAFGDESFERVFAGHFYGHLEEDQRERFLLEARRVANEVVIVDASRRHANVDSEMQERMLNDGSRWTVFKRYFTGAGLAKELGGGEVLHEGRWFVVVRA
jgi:ubiquinone/menaquinone biosynthesis C-methylase UbiE